METRRLINSALPRPLVLAQAGLYLWALYAIGWNVMRGDLPGWELLLGLVRVLAAYGVANESRLGYWLAVVTCAVGVVPALEPAVRAPWLLVQPAYLVLLVMPVAIVFLLLSPAARDYERTWFR